MLGPARQVRSLGGFPGAAAADGGGVDQPYVVASQSSVPGEDADAAAGPARHRCRGTPARTSRDPATRRRPPSLRGRRPHHGRPPSIPHAPSAGAWSHHRAITACVSPNTSRLRTRPPGTPRDTIPSPLRCRYLRQAAQVQALERLVGVRVHTPPPMRGAQPVPSRRVLGHPDRLSGSSRRTRTTVECHRTGHRPRHPPQPLRCFVPATCDSPWGVSFPLCSASGSSCARMAVPTRVSPVPVPRRNVGVHAVAGSCPLR